MISVNQWGTFDVANYGDLLFPLILERELRWRLGNFSLTLSSPAGGQFIPEPSKRVKRITRFEESAFYDEAMAFDAFVLGGGDIVRLDDTGLAQIYNVSEAEAETNRLFSVFLYDLGRIASIFPVFWNAIGVPLDFTPDQHSPVRKSLENVKYLSVRDTRSKARLEQIGVDKEVHLVPDSGFLISTLFPKQVLLSKIQTLKKLGHFPSAGKVLSVQLNFASSIAEVQFANTLLKLTEEFPDLTIVLVPIGVCHGDVDVNARIAQVLGRRAITIRPEVEIEEIASIIAYSDYFVGSSLHGNLTAFAYGVDSVFLRLPPYEAIKLDQYAEMLMREGRLITSIEHLSPGIRALINNQLSCDRRVLNSIHLQIEKHFDHLATEIEACQPALERVKIEQLAKTHRERVAPIS